MLATSCSSASGGVSTGTRRRRRLALAVTRPAGSRRAGPQVQERVLADGGRSQRVLARDRRDADLLHEAGKQPARLGGAPRRKRKPPGSAPGREHVGRGRSKPRRVQASRCRRGRAGREAPLAGSSVHESGRSLHPVLRKGGGRRARPRPRGRRGARSLVLRDCLRAVLLQIPGDRRRIRAAHRASRRVP